MLRRPTASLDTLFPTPTDITEIMIIINTLKQWDESNEDEAENSDDPYTEGGRYVCTNGGRKETSS